VIFDSLMGMFSLDMGIDLGTCNTLVCVKGQGDRPQRTERGRGQEGDQFAYCRTATRVGLVGQGDAWQNAGGSITAIRPLKDGVISDFEITEAMLSYFIRRVHGRKQFHRAAGW